MVAKLTARQASEQSAAKLCAAKAAVAEGARQFAAALTSGDPRAIAAHLALWQANHAQYVANCAAIEALGLPITITGKRLAIMRTLFFAPGRQMTLSALCKVVHLSPAAGTNYVDSLSRGSMVRRTCSPEDRHTNIVELTPRGEAAFRDIAQALARSWTDACADFTDAEKDILVSLLRRLA